MASTVNCISTSPVAPSASVATARTVAVWVVAVGCGAVKVVDVPVVGDTVPMSAVHATVTDCPVSGADAVALMVWVAPPSMVPPPKSSEIRGARFALTIQVRVAVPVSPSESVTVAVTTMFCCAAVTAGAVNVADQLLPVCDTVLSVPRVVDNCMPSVALSSSTSLTVPDMVVTDSPSTTAEAVVNVMVGCSLGGGTRSVMVRVVVAPRLSVATAVTRRSCAESVWAGAVNVVEEPVVADMVPPSGADHAIVTV